MREILEKAITSCRGNIDINDFTPVIWGCGNTAVLYQNGFERESFEPFAYVDNSEQKQKKGFMGKKVLSVNSLIELSADKNIKPVLVFICSANSYVIDELEEQLANLNLNHLTIDEYIFSKNKDKVLKTYDLMSDEQSKEIYATLIISRIQNKKLPEKLYDRNHYFSLPEFVVRSSSEVLADFGAFVGDSVEQYIWNNQGVFKKIYAFEPDERNFNAMCYRIERLKKEWAIGDNKIELVFAGVGKETTDACFTTRENDNSSLGASFTKNETDFDAKVKIYSIDDYFKDKELSFIKADIESYEYDMLLGAQNTIKKRKPKIAVCIYHNATDMYSIALLLKEINPDYKFSVRHHYVDASCETVLYAY